MAKRNRKWFDKVALELGHITEGWSRLERILDHFIAELAHIDEQPVAHIITGNSDLRAKVQMAKGLAFLRQPSLDWFESVIGILNWIDNDLRVRRNVAIHEPWFKPKGRLTQISRKTKLKRPQSFQFSLETEREIPVKMRDLHSLKSDINGAFFDVLVSLAYVLRDDEETDSTSPQISFAQYLLMVRHEIHLKRARPKLSPQQRASFLRLRRKAVPSSWPQSSRGRRRPSPE
jgi:hypothetical protein